MRQHGYFEGPGTYLVSYPRSGANWLRYCLEAIVQLPTLGVDPFDPKTPLDLSVEEALNSVLGSTLGFTSEGSDILLQHSHRWRHAGDAVDIVMIVRNYKECILRDFRGTIHPTREDFIKEIARRNSLDILCHDGGIGTPKDGWGWGDLLCRYAAYAGRKHIVYYEDLKIDPENTLRELLEFLNAGELSVSPIDIDKKLNEFMTNIEHHNKVSIVLYNNGVAKSYTRGSKNMSHHADEFLTKKDRIQWDEYVKENFPTIVPLVSRYFEK